MKRTISRLLKLASQVKFFVPKRYMALFGAIVVLLTQVQEFIS